MLRPVPLLVCLALPLAACDCGGTGPGPGALGIVPADLSFGPVPVGLASRLPLALANQGSGILELDIPRLGTLAGHLRLEGVPASILPNAMAEVQVVFAPQARGDYDGDVEIPTLAGELGKFRVTGIGVDARLLAEPRSIDFGEVVLGESATATAALLNAGDSSIEIKSLGGDPNTPVDFSVVLPGIVTLPPGERLSFLVRFVPIVSGVRTGRIVANTDLPSLPLPPSLELRGEGLIAEVEVAPALVSFQGVLIGESRRRELELRNLSTRTQTVSSMELVDATRPNIFELEAPVLPMVIGPSETRRVGLSYTPIDLEMDTATIWTRVVGLPSALLVSLAGQGEPSPRANLSAWPSRLDFGSVQRGVPSRRRLWISNDGASAAALALHIEPPGAPFQLSGHGPPAGLSGFDLHVQELEIVANNSGSIGAELVIEGDGGVVRVSVPISAEVIAGPVPELVVSPDRVDFGRVPRGETRTRYLRLSNAGGASLSLDAPVIDDPAGLFSLPAVPGPSVLVPGQSVWIQLAFSDASGLPATHSATLLLSGDPDGPIVFPLSAVGDDPLVSDAPLGVVLLVSGPADVDLDLHLIRESGALYDAPNDLCACNPSPNWPTPRQTVDEDPVFGSQVLGPGFESAKVFSLTGETLRLSVVNNSAVDGQAELHLSFFGRSYGSIARSVAAGTVWEAVDLELDGAVPTLSVIDAPLQPLSDEACF